MSTHKPVHRTSPIFLEEFKSGHIKPLSDSQEEISDIIVKHLSRKAEDLMARQRDAQAHFKYQGPWSLAKLENIHDLAKFIDIVNDVFFNGVLNEYCGTEVVDYDWTALRHGHLASGDY